MVLILHAPKYPRLTAGIMSFLRFIVREKHIEEYYGNNWSFLEIDKVVIRSERDDQLIFLRQVGGEIIFPIAVGLYEAAALKSAIESPIASRPWRP